MHTSAGRWHRRRGERQFATVGLPHAIELLKAANGGAAAAASHTSAYAGTAAEFGCSNRAAQLRIEFDNYLPTHSS